MGQGMSARTGTTGGLGLSSAFSAALSSRTSTRQGITAQAGRQLGQFVGADTSDVRNILGFVTNPNQATQAWRQGLTALRGATGLQPNQRTGRFTGNVGGRGTSAGGEIPAYVAPGFSYSPPEPVSVATTLQTRLQKAGLIGAEPKIQVSVEGGVVVLRGEVATSNQRLVAENLARLEPGVREVRNEIVITGQSASPPSTP
jgi:hypothetical protein